MAKTATRAPARPAAKPAPAPSRATSAPSKAAQAAQHQGRAAPKEEPRKPSFDLTRSPPRTEAGRQERDERRSTVPAVARSAPLPADFGSSANIPAFMRQDMGAGKENIGNDDLEIPRLKLMQGLSKELETYNELRPGFFFHSASETIFDQAFRAVPIYMERAYILWRPRDAGGGILARAPDGVHWQPESGEFTVQLDKKDGGDTVTWKLAKTVAQSGLANWGTMNPRDPKSPPAATLMYNYLLAFPDEPDLMPAVLTFQRSSIKMGRKLNTKLKTVRTPIYGSVFEFKAFVDTNSRGQDFQNVQATGAGLVEDEALYNKYKDMNAAFTKNGINIKDVDSLQDDPVGDNQPDDTQGDGKSPQY